MPVGYNPQALGRTRAAWYTKDAVGRLIARSATINFLSVPRDLFGVNAESQHDARWGAGSFRRFKWQSLDNESRLSVAAALTWACQARRGDLLGWSVTSVKPIGVDCSPSEVEIIDALATGHGAILGATHQIATGAPGTTADLAITVRDAKDATGKPRTAGLFSERDQFWPLDRWYMNVVTVPIEPENPPDDPEEPEDPEEPTVTPIDQRVAELVSLATEDAQQISGDALRSATLKLIRGKLAALMLRRAIEIYRRGKT
jgi:hypothetical protein